MVTVIYLVQIEPKNGFETEKVKKGYRQEGTGTLPDYLVNRDDQKNEGPFGGKNCTEIEK